jgi:hypothetical protein
LCIDTGDTADTVVWHPAHGRCWGELERDIRIRCVEAASGGTDSLCLNRGAGAFESAGAGGA